MRQKRHKQAKIIEKIKGKIEKFDVIHSVYDTRKTKKKVRIKL